MKLPFSRTVKTWLKIRRTYRSKGWIFSSNRRYIYVFDMDEWLKYYLPFSVEGLTILDVGAGEGETARFYLEHGAKKVICIESDPEAFKLLLKNSQGRSMVCLNKKFSISDLNMDFDLVKVDIEGDEEALLNVDCKKAIVVEIHSPQLAEKFRDKGYIIQSRSENHPQYSFRFGFKPAS